MGLTQRQKMEKKAKKFSSTRDAEKMPQNVEACHGATKRLQKRMQRKKNHYWEEADTERPLMAGKKRP